MQISKIRRLNVPMVYSYPPLPISRRRAPSAEDGDSSLLLPPDLIVVLNAVSSEQPTSAGASVRLPLAAGAPEPAAFLAGCPLLTFLDRRSASSARAARAPVGPVFPPGPAISGRHVPGPFLVGVGQPVPELGQPGKVVNRPDGPPRVDAAQEQRL